MNNNNLERLNLNVFQPDENTSTNEKTDLDKTNNSEYISETIMMNIEKELNKLEAACNETDLPNRSSKNYLKKNDELIEIKALNKNILYVHELHVKMLFIYIIFTIIFSVIILYKSKQEDKYFQEYSYKWVYQCPLIPFDILLNLIEIILLLYLIILVLKIWNYVFVFKCTKYITYSSVVWITLGPFLNVIFFFQIKYYFHKKIK